MWIEHIEEMRRDNARSKEEKRRKNYSSGFSLCTVEYF